MAQIALNYSAAQINAAIAKINSLVSVIEGSIVQLYDGTTAIYPRTKAEAVFFDNDTSKTLDQQFSQLEQGQINLDKKVQFLFSVVWRDDRRIIYDPTTKKIYIRGIKTAPSSDNTLCYFSYKGINYTIKDDIEEKVFTDAAIGNFSLYIPSSNINVDYTLNDIVGFENNIERPGYVHLTNIVYGRETAGNLIQNLPEATEIAEEALNKSINPILKNHTLEIRWRGTARLFWDSTNYKLYWSNGVTSDSNNVMLLLNYKEKRISLSNSVQERIFNNLDGNNQLLLPIPVGDSIIYTLDDIIILSGDTYNEDSYVKIAHICFSNALSSFIIDTQQIEKQILRNPILKNHTEEIRYRGLAQLYWDENNKIIYWSNGSTTDSSGTQIQFIRKLSDNDVRIVRLGIGDYKQKDISSVVGNGNAQVLLPLPSSAGQSQVYTLNDIIINQGSTYDDTAYVKIAHITFGNSISSFIIKKEIKSQNFQNLVLKSNNNTLDIESLISGYNYVDSAFANQSVGSDGIMEYYNGRTVIMFRLPKQGEAPTIDINIQPSAYQWYSGHPDYITGSNSLGRTTTNTPPSNAKYCALTWGEGTVTYCYIQGESYIDNTRAEIGLLGANLNNSIGENNFANGLRTNLKILGYGNSFMRNSVAYLSAIANGCGVNLTVGNLYTGGTYLLNHYNALRNNSAEYEWHKYVNGVETQSQSGQTPMRGLLEERWDIIILHQYNVQNHPFEPVLNNFIKLIIDKIGYCPKIYINATWAYHEDYIEEYVSDYYSSELEMWQDMMDKCTQACKDSGVADFSIIPTGTAIQNARTLSWADDYIRFCNGGTDLHHLNPAGGFIAACTIFQKIITKLNGISCNNTTFRINSPVAMPPSNEVQQGILVTDSNYQAMCKCAIDAVNNPNIITQQ